MPYFTPPTAPLVPAALRPNHPGYQLFKHYRPWDAGVNVWLLNDGTLTPNDPADESLVRRVFHGGHVHEVNDAEATTLTAAGFTVTAV